MSNPGLPPSDGSLSRFRQLLAQMADGTLTDDDGREMAEVMRAGAPARDLYLDYVALHVLLDSELSSHDADRIKRLTSERQALAETRRPVTLADSASLTDSVSAKLAIPAALQPAKMAALCAPAPSAAAKQPSALYNALQQGVDFLSRPAPLAVTVATASITAVLVVMALVRIPGFRPDTTAATHSSESPSVVPALVARLTAIYGAEWVDAHRTPTDRGMIAAGESLHLASGLAEVTFQDGAQVMLEGPATLRIDGTDRGTLGFGQLSARVPQRAIGFTVETPEMTVVDLGTEFGVAVEPNGAVEVHVIEGSVSASFAAVGQEPRRTLQLVQREALRVETRNGSTRTSTPIDMDEHRFARVLTSDPKARPRPPRIKMEPGDRSEDYAFPTIPGPSSDDLADQSAGKASIQVIGQLYYDSASQHRLIDGIGAALDKSRGNHVLHSTLGGMFLLDLGQRVQVTQVNTYSWHIDGRPDGASQQYELYGSKSETVPPTDGFLPSRGWRRIAQIDTEKELGSSPDCPFQQGVSISGSGGPLGEFRYLLWVLPQRPHGTFFDEFDVFGLPMPSIDSPQHTNP